MTAQNAANNNLRCRNCESDQMRSVLDLGTSPPANSNLTQAQLWHPEPFYPLHLYFCRGCALVQLPQFHRAAEILEQYDYFSSYSDSWLKHAENYVNKAIDRYELGERSQVVEVASNDGYLLQYFMERGIPVLGVDPARNVAQEALQKGIPTHISFFGLEKAQSVSTPSCREDTVKMPEDMGNPSPLSQRQRNTGP